MRASPFPFVVLALALTAEIAMAEERCPVPEGGTPALAAEDVTARLTYVRTLMRDQSRRARTWTWAWSGIGYGLAAGQYGLIALYPADKRVEQVFAGTASFYLPASIAVLPLRVRTDDVELESVVAKAQTQSGILSPCLVLARAEELLAHSADDESAHTNALQHVITIVLSAGYAGVMWALFHDVAGVIVNGGGAVVIGETQLLTAPRGAIGGLARYRRGDIGLAPSAPPLVSWTIAPLGMGLSVVGSF